MKDDVIVRKNLQVSHVIAWLPSSCYKTKTLSLAALSSIYIYIYFSLSLSTFYFSLCHEQQSCMHSFSLSLDLSHPTHPHKPGHKGLISEKKGWLNCSLSKWSSVDKLSRNWLILFLLITYTRFYIWKVVFPTHPYLLTL